MWVRLVLFLGVLGQLQSFSLKGLRGLAPLSWPPSPSSSLLSPPLSPRSKPSASASASGWLRQGHLAQQQQHRITALAASACQALLSQPLKPHPNLVRQTLPNGLECLVLSHPCPPGHFEAFLEILSGSAMELEHQQGMAHLLEHVNFMGSPNRYRLANTGSRSNAFTDFHQSVYFASCPTMSGSKELFPVALDALLDVMTTKVDAYRLNKEKSAVLSEASMINTMEYRVESNILSAMHLENRISRRFPIGKEELIRSWTVDDVQYFHSLHYRPDNAKLYVVGDIDHDYAFEHIAHKFGPLVAKLNTSEILSLSGEFPKRNMRHVHRHYPPVTHRWATRRRRPEVPAFDPNDSPVNSLTGLPSLSSASPIGAGAAALSVAATPAPVSAEDNPLQLPEPRLFSHELLQYFSFHIMAKQPIESVRSYADLKREFMQKMTISALQIRMGICQRTESLFSFVDFNMVNWPREGCAVCSLDLTADPLNWKKAIFTAVGEIARLGRFGLTHSELKRFKQSLSSELSQIVAHESITDSETTMRELMATESYASVFLHRKSEQDNFLQIIQDITLEEVNEVARNLCEHIVAFNATEGILPNAIVASLPTKDRLGNPFSISPAEVSRVLTEALQQPLEPLPEISVPDHLLSPAMMEEKKKLHPPAWRPETVGPPQGESEVLHRQLTNGIDVHIKSSSFEAKKAFIQLVIHGGRMVEPLDRPGLAIMSARTLQEGGAFLNYSRQDVELFCVDNMINVEIRADQEALVVTISSLTDLTSGSASVSSIEAAFQVAHTLLSDLKVEEDAFERARLFLHEDADKASKILDAICQDQLVENITRKDPRFLVPNHDQIRSISFAETEVFGYQQMLHSPVQVAVVADMQLDELEKLSLEYLGPLPRRASLQEAAAESDSSDNNNGNSRRVQFSVDPVFLNLTAGESLMLHIPDKEERAIGLLAGPSPGRTGAYSDGSTLTERMEAMINGSSPVPLPADLAEELKLDNVLSGKNQSMLNFALVQLIREIANRRLFSVVRESRQLTYDANFNYLGMSRGRGGWFQVQVVTHPKLVSSAILASQDALLSLRGRYGVDLETFHTCKKTLLGHFLADIRSNHFWVEELPGSRNTDLLSFEAALNSISYDDIRLAIAAFNFNSDQMTACIASACPEQPPNDIEAQAMAHIQSSPSAAEFQTDLLQD